MKNLNARYTSGTAATLLVFAKTTKARITVAARMKEPGQRAQSGCHEHFTTEQEADALAAFNRLCAAALKAGWTLRQRTMASAFLEMPMAPVVKTEPAKKGKAA